MKDILAAMICIIIFALGFVSGTMFNRYDTVKTTTEIIRTDRLTGEDAERYALVFHLKRANSLGIEIPDDILLAADEVYRD